MALNDDIQVLSNVKLLRDFTAEQLRLLAFGAETLRLPSGRELYREAQAADCAYVVVSGKITLFREVEGERVELASVGPGEMMGELAVIASSKRLTGAVASADSEIIRLSRTLFRRILEEYPEAAAILHARISEELQNLLGEIQKLAPRFSD